jgi:hypothetical protein
MRVNEAKEDIACFYLFPHCDFMAFSKDDAAFLLLWLSRVGGSTSIASSRNNRTPGFSMYTIGECVPD